MVGNFIHPFKFLFLSYLTLFTMLEKYNYQINKLLKLCALLLATYFSISNVIPELDQPQLLKIVALVGIIFIILESYYPNIYYE